MTIRAAIHGILKTMSVRPHIRALTRCMLCASVSMLHGCGPGRSDPGGGALTVLAVLGEVGRSPGQFLYPRALAADSTSLWVIDKSARVQRLDPETGRAVLWWTMPEYQLGFPTGVTVVEDAAGPVVYVADTHYHRVMVYRPVEPVESRQIEPELLASFGGYGDGNGQFIFPTDVAVARTETGAVHRIYVSEYGGNDRISTFDVSYSFLFSFGSFGASSAPAAVEFNRPQSMQIDAARSELIVTDACNHRIGRFTLDGRLIAWIGSDRGPGDAPGQFMYPYGLALLDDGTALVAEFGNNRVQHIDLVTGRSLGIYGAPGVGEGELANPWGVAVLGGTAYVLDSGNNRVQAFRSPGKGAGR